MKTNFKISIPTACHEDWNQMTSTETGRFCGSCTKNVVDFTAMLPVEIQKYFTENKDKNICGRFKNEQLETINIQVPSNVLNSQISFHKAFLLALFIAMGTTLFSCKDANGNHQTIGEVAVVDTLNDNFVTKGILLPPKKDTIDLSKETIGKIDETKLDTVHHFYKLPPIPTQNQVKFINQKKQTKKENIIHITTKGDIVFETQTPEIDEVMGVIYDSTIKDTTKQPEILGKPAIENPPKPEK
jgi:hypothetical protein